MGSESALKIPSRRSVKNDLSGLVAGVADGALNWGTPYGPGASQTIAQPFTFSLGTQYTPFTLNRVALSYGYMGYGLVQTLVDQPVEDAFRGGLEIESDELDEEDIKVLHRYMRDNKDIEAIKNAAKWARLYGGAGLIIDTEQDSRTPLNTKALKPDSVLRFIAADRWELTLTTTNVNPQMGLGFPTVGNVEVPYLYYMQPLNTTRVLKLLGREAPSYIRMRLQGWGMSELERCLREINSFVKFQNVIFELIDEAKIDIFKIQGLNDALATDQSTQSVVARVQLNSLLKNYKNATVMDKEDDYDQKQMVWSGLADIYKELRQNLSAALKIPENKLFGQSASGFASGEDAMENYNSLVESDVREKLLPICHEVIALRCQQIFGFVPDFQVGFKPLRILNAVEEEAVNTSIQNRVLQLFTAGLMTGMEAMESLDKDKLLNVDTEVQRGERDVGPVMDQGDQVEEEGRESKENAISIAALMRAKKERAEFDKRDNAILSKLKRAA